jgi:hypothetical protein
MLSSNKHDQIYGKIMLIYSALHYSRKAFFTGIIKKIVAEGIY